MRRPVLDFPTSATDLRAGNGTFCAVPEGADRTCWGLNASGEIDDGTTTDRTAPVDSTHLAGATAYDLGGTFSGGAERATVCKVVSGQARCRGYNGQGQLGNGTTTASVAPVTVLFDDDPDPDVVNLVPLTGVTPVAAGGDHGCAIVGGGQVWCWGANGSGQLGDNTHDARVGAVKVQQDTDPDADALLTGATAIIAGNSHSCALLAQPSVRLRGGALRPLTSSCTHASNLEGRRLLRPGERPGQALLGHREQGHLLPAGARQGRGPDQVPARLQPRR